MRLAVAVDIINGIVKAMEDRGFVMRALTRILRRTALTAILTRLNVTLHTGYHPQGNGPDNERLERA